MPSNSLIARPGHNCWRRVHADRLAFLVDAANYFEMLAAAVERTQRSFFLVGWDVHSRVRLRRPKDGDGITLAAALDAAARREGKFRAFVLDWDFAPVYQPDREWLPTLQFRQRTHRHVRFRLDDDHPLGASQHQKIVVCDDRLAFIGGIDIAPARWDTREHRVDESRRRTPSGASYHPFHDVQVAVDGEAAAALGELCRDRWHRATGRDARTHEPPRGADPWPDSLSPDVCDVTVALARTEAPWRDRESRREIEQFYLDAIAAARQSIYIENQYLTSAAIGEALRARLEESDGPEVVIVAPRQCEGWLEQATMGALRARLLRRLRGAEHGDRLRVLSPVVGEDGAVDVMVHAKVFVVDDRAVRVGSSNLSNRSMGLDTECDLWLEAEGRADVTAAIAGLRNGLLAEHLGVGADDVAAALREEGSLVAAVDRLRDHPGRTLQPISEDIDPWTDSFVPEADVVDPEQPVALERITDQLDPDSVALSPRQTTVRIVSIVVAIVALIALWRWTPIADILDRETASAALQGYRSGVMAPVFALGLFTVASLLVAPVTVLTVLAGLVFGPWTGFFAASCGSLLSAVIAFGLGRSVMSAFVERRSGKWLTRVNERLRDNGLVSMIVLRLVPVAPYTVVNFVAGASRVRFRHFFVGTAVVMVPGALLLTVFAETSRRFVENPEPRRALVAAIVGIGIVALSAWVRRRVQVRAEKRA